VLLLDEEENPLAQTQSGQTGEFRFADVVPGDYFVMAIEPLGYTVAENPKFMLVPPGATKSLLFEIAPMVLANNSRGKGYWRHQFDTYLSGTGKAQENQTDLTNAIEEVQSRYTPHYAVFAEAKTFSDWSAILAPSRKAVMLDRAKEQLAALVLNLSSLKVGQRVVVTEDGITAGEVLTFVSTLVVDGDPSNDELAKGVAEKVNDQRIIGAGIVPASNLLYKGNSGSRIDWGFGRPVCYALEQNYPNPFNPSTVIRYSLPQTSSVTLAVFNSIGQQVATLVQGEREAGYLEVRFDATGLSSGVYFYQLQAGNYVATKKLLLLK
jgi:hypothetical protein